MRKIYLLLVACCFGFVANAAQIFQPSTMASFTGANTYCIGASISPLTFTYNICNNGGGAPSPATCTLNWYYNTTNSTVVAGATLASGPIVYSCGTGATESVSFTPSISVGGDYYYFCVITWTGGSVPCGGTTGTLTTGTTTQLVKVGPPPIAPAGPTNICVGSNITLTDAFTGGTWSSSNSGVVSVNASGIATGATVGGAFITYTWGTCGVTTFIFSNDTPTIITPTGPVNLCVGSTTTLADASLGGTWSSSASGIASVGTGGLVSAFAAGIARISYTYTSTGCYTSKVVTVQANPAAISGSSGVCVGGNTTLTDGSPGGVWLSSNTAVASITFAGGVVTGNTTGTVTITYTLPSSCFTTTTMTVNSAPAAITGLNQVCAGSNITLADVTAGGTWSSTSGTGSATVGTSGVVTGVLPGTVTISYTTTGCTPATRVITINSLPGTLAGVFSTCYGDSTALTTTGTGGGTWSSSNTSIATVDSVSGHVYGILMGTTTIMYTVGGCSSSVVVTVNPLAPIVGSDSVCVASQISLTDIVGGGTWVSSNPAVAGVNASTGLVTGLVTGITYIGYSLPTGCHTTFFLNVIPALPSIAGALTICSGSVASLSNGVTGGTWKSANQYVAAVDSLTGALSGHFPDTVSISYSVFGCVTTTQITVNPLPTPTLAYVASLNSLSVSSMYASYQWFDSTSTGMVAIPGATNNTYGLYAPGKFAVMVTDFNGCSSRTEFYKYHVGVKEITAGSFHIFPNPAVSTVSIESPVKVKAVISSTDGKALLSVDDAKEIGISDLASGMYFISLYDESGQLVTVQKLIKQ